MEETRRYFLMTLVATASCFCTGLPGYCPDAKDAFPTPAPAVQQNPAETDAAKQGPEREKRTAGKQMKKSFAQALVLYRMASGAEAGSRQVPTSDLFSVQMYRRTEEIEKLAHSWRRRGMMASLELRQFQRSEMGYADSHQKGGYCGRSALRALIETSVRELRLRTTHRLKWKARWKRCLE
jgi:hypothetical protein